MDDLKLLYRTAGAEGKGITFVFLDSEIKDEAFLEYLNNVLSSGEVRISPEHRHFRYFMKQTSGNKRGSKVEIVLWAKVNPVLSCVQVSSLFAKDELQEITQNLISVMKKELPRIPPTFDNLYDFFISRARKNLHVVLCFSPVSLHFTKLTDHTDAPSSVSASVKHVVRSALHRWGRSSVPDL